MTGTPKTVYFMRQVGVICGPVKIGCSSYVPGRLENLSVWSPVPLEVAASFPGNFGDERRLHCHFEADLSHHEWFRWSPELEAVIVSVASGTFDINSIPMPPKKHRPGTGRSWTEEARKEASMRLRVRAAEKRSGLVVPYPITDELIEAFVADPSSVGVPPAERAREASLRHAEYFREKAREAETLAADWEARIFTPTERAA